MTENAMAKSTTTLTIQLNESREERNIPKAIHAQYKRAFGAAGLNKCYVQLVESWHKNAINTISNQFVLHLPEPLPLSDYPPIKIKDLCPESREEAEIRNAIGQLARALDIQINEDWDKANMLALAVQKVADSDRVDEFVNWVTIREEKEFEDLRSSIKGRHISEERFAAAKLLNEIEERVERFPMCSVAEAVKLMGELDNKNPSRTIATAKKRLSMFAFSFGNAKSIQIPIFQFDQVNLGVYEAVPLLCNILDGLNDWGIYQWLTTFNEDLEMTPAEAISKPDLMETTLFLAGLFKSRSTFEDLSFTAVEATDDDK